MEHRKTFGKHQENTNDLFFVKTMCLADSRHNQENRWKTKTRFWKTSGKQENRWKTIGKWTENMENKENIEENVGKQWKTGKRTENMENIEENIDCFVNG